VCVLITATSAGAAEYYVATSGSDTNTGTSLSAPFKTISAAASIMGPGDTCYIRGGTYRETVTPANSGTNGALITFMPYASEAVTISGADTVAGWSVYSNSIYKANMAWDLGAGFNQLFVDGAMVNEARWPNTSTNLLSPTTASAMATATTVTFTVSRPVDYWVGGVVYGLFGSKWTSQGASITASTSGGSLSVTGKTSNWYTGSGSAYISGILGELDTAGEWFLQGTNLYFWAPGSVDPSTVIVETKARKWCINLSGKSYIRIQDIDMFAGSIRMDADNCEIIACDVRYLSHFTKYTWGGMDAGGNRTEGDNGVYIDGVGNVVSNCSFTYSAGSGILIYGASNTVTRSEISQMDYSATYSCPLSIKGSTGGNRILFNTMHDTARDVLQLYGANADVIMYNEMHNAGRMCHDLGITYQWGRDGQGTVMAYNWIHDNLATGGSNPGIYNDNYSRNFIQHHNVIWNCEAGIRLNGPHDAMQVYNNTLFGCSDVGTYTYNQWPNYTPAYWVYGNIMVSSRSNNLYLASSPGSQLQDYAAYDFRLKPGAAAIDAGVAVPPYTDGWLGTAPDLGAYETGRSKWTAGRNGVALQPLNTPIVINEAATGVLIDTATLNGSLTSTGGAHTVVVAFWGDNDAGQVQTNWDHLADFGIVTATPPVSFTTNLTGLIPGMTYYCRFFATNAFGEAWGSVQSFMPVLPFATQTLSCPPSMDLDIKPDGSRRSGLATLTAGNDTSSVGPDRRVFMKFDLSGIQSNWAITRAVLRLYHVEGASDNYGTATLYSVTNAWNEMSLNYAHPVGSSLGQIVGNSGLFNDYKELDVTTVIQGYQTDTNSHHGFSIRGEEGYTLTGKYFVALEGSAGQRPELVVSYSVPDSDSDGIPDAWEWQYFVSLTNTTSTSDSDGDGFSDYSEYMAGTIPTNAGSLLALTNALATEGGERVLWWPSVSNRTYSVSRTENIMGTWTNISGSLTATPPVNVYTDSTPVSAEAVFYRVRLD